MNWRMLLFRGQREPSTHSIRDYGIPVLSTAVAIAGSKFMMAAFGAAGAYSLPVLAIVVSAWFGGIGLALLSQLVSGAIVFIFIARAPDTHIRADDIYAALLFLLIGKLALLLTASFHWTEHLRRLKLHFEMLARATHDCLWDWDFGTGEVLRVGNLRGVFGITEREILTPISWWRERVDPEESERVWASLRSVIDGGETRWSEEYRLRRDDGSYVTVADRGCVVRDKSGKATHMVGGMADVSARRNAEERLVRHAFHDALTGLPNRELFLDRLERSVALHDRADSIAVLFLDLDRFKVVNDSLGHSVGDRLLAQAAERISQCLRQGDTAARFGGDEFTILLEDVKTAADAMRVAGRLQDSFTAPFKIDDYSIAITASIGIAFAKAGNAQEVLRQADIAMYRAKAHGKARFEVFEPSLDARALNLLQIEADLRKSIQNGDFRLFYQPIVSIRSDQVVGFEALLRWNHPRRGILQPSEFLSVAEEAGLTISLGRWVLRESCKRLKSWRQMHPAAKSLSMSVNLSGREFMQPALVEQLSRVLKETQLDGSALIIELTESMITESSELSIEKLRNLRRLGIRLAIDDFGRGYSSLARLQEFPISILKVDGAFISRISEGKSQIFDAIMALASELKLEVTAEGVETEEQYEYLKKSRTSMGQGLFFSGALTARAAEELLRTDRLKMANHRVGSEGKLVSGSAAG